jgi:serine/threonine protein kinase
MLRPTSMPEGTLSRKTSQATIRLGASGVAMRQLSARCRVREVGTLNRTIVRRAANGCHGHRRAWGFAPRAFGWDAVELECSDATHIGTRLGPYEIVAPLGAGGMGEVYRALDTRLGRDVAVKVMPPHLIENAEARARFEREARVISALNHPHICVLYDLGREGGIDYLVMELVDGESLAHRVARGPLSTARGLRVGAEIADALDRAHRAGVVHRDLKPGNVMLSKSGAKLMDFGLARERRGGVLSSAGSGPLPMSQSPTIATPLTSEGALMGTSHYMAPEQLEGREADARSDIWALGCVLYEMATGRRAYEGATSATLISSIMKDEPRPLIDLVPLAPTGLDRVIRACLAKDPEQRWQNAHDVAVALRWPQADAAATRVTSTLVERQFILTAAHVRQLAERNPRLVGYPVTYVDNQVQTDQLVVFLHGLGADGGSSRCS